jgi:hypothetical protein
MFVPQWAYEEFGRLSVDADPLANLKSLERLGDWIDDMKVATAARAKDEGHTLQAIGEVQSKPRQAVHRTLKAAQSRGFTDPAFDGVDSSTLRYWFDWWSADERTPKGAEEAGRDPKTEAARVLAELEARYDAGVLRKRPGGLKGLSDG